MCAKKILRPLNMTRECGGLVVESLTPEGEIGALVPTDAVLCPSKDAVLEKYWLYPGSGGYVPTMMTKIC